MNRWGQRDEGNMTDKISLLVHLDYDAEAEVWYIAKSDIPGLSLEASTASALVDKILATAPELLELNEGLLVDGIEAHVNEPRLNLPETRTVRQRPRMSVMPIFDTPLELACA